MVVRSIAILWKGVKPAPYDFLTKLDISIRKMYLYINLLNFFANFQCYVELMLKKMIHNQYSMYLHLFTYNQLLYAIACM